MIYVNNLEKSFGKNKVLKGVNEHIKKGEVVVVIGPSGSGKSTFLRCLNLLEEPTGGEIIFEGKNITDKKVNINKLREKMGMVFQQFNLFPHKTVLENITIAPIKVKKMKKSDAEAKAIRLLEKVGLENKKDAYPAQLSGGQQQRVAIARALAKKPDILLLDEPLSNLDTKLRVETRQEIRRIQKETGVTAIFVTHDQEEAMCISDEIVLMKDGDIQQISSPSDIYMNPCNKFVASFIGSPEMNFIPLNVENGIAKVDSLEVNNLPLDKKNVLMGVRAEDFEVAESGLKTIVKTVEILGRERLLTLTHNQTEYKMLVEKEFEIEEGKELIVRPKLGKSYVFDAESEAFITKC